jgi:transcriptional regulator NrdR family protein
MAKCPNCGKETTKLEKSWKFSQFDVQAFSCSNCGTRFREYSQDGIYSFTLKLRKGSKQGRKVFVKA